MGKLKNYYFQMALGGILWRSERISHAKFEANRIIFRGGASDLKSAHVFVFDVEVSIHLA